jgi:hypothetical protein
MRVEHGDDGLQIRLEVVVLAHSTH